MNIRSFRPIRLRVGGIGPFRNGQVEELDFRVSETGTANFFLLVSANGRGKTTLLEAMAHLLGLLDDTPSWESNSRWALSARSEHLLQLDLAVETDTGSAGEPELSILTLYDGTGRIPTYKLFSSEDLQRLSAVRQVLWGVARSDTGTRIEPQPHGDVWLDKLRTELQSSRTKSIEGPQESAPSEDMPSALYFTAYRNLAELPVNEERDISRPGEWSQRVLRICDREDRWSGSLDKLFVWLYWLEDGAKGRFKAARDVANKIVFQGTNKVLESVQKDPPEMVVRVDGRDSHRLDQLSSGEKNLLQLFVRTAGLDHGRSSVRA